MTPPGFGNELCSASLVERETAAMQHSQLCQCGYDCAAFLRQHEITGGAYFECPSCDAGLTALPAPVAGTQVGLGDSLTLARSV